MTNPLYDAPTGTSLVFRALRRFPERTAFAWDGGSISYAGTLSLIARMHPDKTLIAAGLLLLLGLVFGVAALGSWHAEAFGSMDPDRTMRLVIPSVTLILTAMVVPGSSQVKRAAEASSHGSHVR